ncbi:MAG: efflux RND transporter periplasmic adaptor subunit [Chitinophagaceae bacterium]
MRYPSLCLLAFVALSCGSKKENKVSSKSNKYPVLTVGQSSTTINNDYPAMVMGIHNVEIRPKIDGFISKIYIDEGATVRKGQLLFTIDAPQYEQIVRTAQANIKIAEADVDAAKMNVEKVKPMVEKDIISDYELKSALYMLEAKQAALSQAKAQLVNAQINLSYTNLYSPVDGVIGLLPFKIGSLVNSSTTTPLTTVSDISSIYCYFSINEKLELDMFSAIKGATIQQKLATWPPATLVLANGAVFPHTGKVETASGLINSQTGAVNLRATFPNPEGLVRSGSSAIVRIPTHIDSALLIPQKSTYQIQGQLFVYKLDSAKQVKSVSVSVLGSSSGQYYVVTSGLKKGDKIVTDGVDGLREGVEIEPVNVNLAQAVSDSTGVK